MKYTRQALADHWRKARVINYRAQRIPFLDMVVLAGIIGENLGATQVQVGFEAGMVTAYFDADPIPWRLSPYLGDDFNAEPWA